jgi:uncharacterized protein (TIGR02284 family)
VPLLIEEVDFPLLQFVGFVWKTVAAILLHSQMWRFIMEKDGKNIKKLNELIEICKDGRTGFWQAASEVERKGYRELLRKQAFQRNAFAFDLRDTALKLGIKPATQGTIIGKLHRAWMSLRHHLNPHSDKVVLLECKRGEEHAVNVYHDVFENNLLPEIQPMLERQFVSMIEMRDDLELMTAEIKPAESPASMLRLL